MWSPSSKTRRFRWVSALILVSLMGLSLTGLNASCTPHSCRSKTCTESLHNSAVQISQCQNLQREAHTIQLHICSVQSVLMFQVPLSLHLLKNTNQAVHSILEAHLVLSLDVDATLAVVIAGSELGL